MAKRLRKTLPKNLNELFMAAAESGDNTPVFSALEACQPDARGGYGKATVISQPGCTPEVARWAIARGTDVNAADTYGNTPLHVVAQNAFQPTMSITDLLEMGADLHAVTHSGWTALHAAIDVQSVPNIQTLLAAGIDLHAETGRGFTALEHGLQRMSNVALVGMVPATQALLDAGAVVTDDAQKFTLAAAERFEFHRAGFNKKTVKQTAAAMRALCTMMGVTPPGHREMHDGTSPIVPNGEGWQSQFAYLWDFLIPSSGPCTTVQGEVVRIAGRIRDELFRNAGGNWDAEYRKMANALLRHLASGQALDAASLSKAKATASALLSDMNGANVLAELAVAWVTLNPGPTPLPPPAYNR